MSLLSFQYTLPVLRFYLDVTHKTKKTHLIEDSQEQYVQQYQPVLVSNNWSEELLRNEKKSLNFAA